jgi:fructokinase
MQGTADWQWSVAELRRIPAATTLLHLGSLACCVAPGAGHILKAAARLRSGGVLVCIDQDVHPEVAGTPARGRLLAERTVRTADVVKVSAGDLGWLYPGRALEDVAAQWLSFGPELIVISCGGDGAMGFRATRTVLHRPAYPARVVDTTGAGDAFTAALVGGLYQLGQANASLQALSGEDLAELIDTCVVAAGLVSGRAGADLPTAAELARAQNLRFGARLERPFAPPVSGRRTTS